MLNSIQAKAADSFIAFHGYSAAVCKLRNTSSVSIDYRVGGTVAALAAGASVVIDSTASTSEVEVRRADLSATPVSVMLDFGVTSDEAYELAAATPAAHATAPAAHGGGDEANANKLVFFGDSLTSGSGSLQPYTNFVPTNTPFTRYNEGLPGRTVLQGIQAIQNRVLDHFSRAAKWNVAAVWLGVNTPRNGEGTYTDAFNYLVALCSQLQRRGFSVVVLTWTSCSDEVALGRDAFNTLVRAQWPLFADAIADVAADARIGSSGAYSNTAYFHDDQRHLIQAGHEIVGPIVGAAVNSITASIERPVGPFRVPGFTDKPSARFGSFQLQSYAVNNCWLSDNIYFDGSGDRYVADGSGVVIRFNDGVLRVQTAAAGAAGEYATLATVAEINGGALVLKSPDGTAYKLQPPNGGGAVSWVAA